MAQPNDTTGPDEISLVYRESRSTLVATAVFSAIVNVLMLTGSLFMLQVYDRVLPSASVPTLVALFGIVAALYAYYGFLEFLRARLMVRMGRKVEERLRGRVFDAVTTHALRRTPGVGSQPLNDIATIRQYLSGQGLFAFFDMPWMPFYLAIIFAMHWILGVASLFAAVSIFVLAVWSERATRTPLAEATKSTVRGAIMTDEGRRNAEALHSLGMAGTMRKRWMEVQQVALDHQTEANDVGGMLSSISRVLRLFIQSGILALGAYLAIQHEISSGSMIAASIIMSRALAPVEQAVANWQQFLGFRKARERLGQALRIVPKDRTLMRLPEPKGRLSVENLTVMLPNIEKPLLQGLTFSVEPGEGIGVVGPTGAGKSTLARALVGITVPTRGHVRIDGATLDQYDPNELGRHIGYLPQDVQLFDGTAAQNISRFQPDANADDIVAAAKLANVHDFIMRLPDGYNTPLGENGARLSTGQRQRLALARALFGDPKLLVLDEPNSALDAEGEAALDFAIRQAMQRGAAVIVIAHRPSALAAIPKMLVLADGKTAALGPRDEIMRKVMVRPTTAQGNVERIGAQAQQSEG